MFSKKIIWKLNIVDIFLIILIILSVSLLVFKSTAGRKNTHYKNYHITFTASDVPVSVVNDIKPGSDCYDLDGYISLGNISIVNILNPYSNPTNEFNNPDENNKKNQNEDAYKNQGISGKQSADSDEYDFTKVILETDVSAVKAEHGIVIDKTYYLKGKFVNVVVGDCVLSGYITDIQ